VSGLFGIVSKDDCSNVPFRGGDYRSRHLLRKYRNMVEWIARDLEVTTLRYQTLEDMIAAIGLPKERLCLCSWTGSYPAPWKRASAGRERRGACKEGMVAAER
jgi:glutamine phosphoribosylpyrophosphate amidotransferase